ncbi:hypothetical protein [Tortoise microvirus 41]|nr:hypothetical protein [Tortoise microvirus 41]
MSPKTVVFGLPTLTPCEVIDMDIRLYYPLPRDFLEHTERSEPELFNYVCYHGKQIFLRRARGRYQVLTANWRPLSLKDLSTEFEKTLGYHVCYNSASFEAAFMAFRKLCVELLTQTTDLFDFDTLEVDPCLA